MGQDEETIEIRQPTVADGAAVHRLIGRCGSLDVNSCYAYLLLCRDFAATSRVAVDPNGTLAGFLSGYRLPAAPQTLFVWQVAVDPDFRRRGLARRMLDDLVRTHLGGDLRFIEATITPDNAASQRLFQRLAEDLQVTCDVTEGFAAADFGGADHQPEDRYRVGPLDAAKASPHAASQVLSSTPPSDN